MNILKLLDGYTFDLINEGSTFEFNNIQTDSRKTKAGEIFFSIVGETVNSHKYIKNCYANGVKLFIVSEYIDIEKDATIIKVENTKNCLAYVCNKINNAPSKSFNLIGVTGTNGKTSTTSFIESILQYSNKKTGSIGTLGIRVDKKEISYNFPTSTTPDCIDLQEIFKLFQKKNVTDAVMEVSSHGLQLDRVSYSDFDIGIFTNLTQDHLDFHKTMENYFDAKRKLFFMSKKCIINIDDTYGKRLYNEFKNKSISIGIDNDCEYKAFNIVYGINYVSFDLYINDRTHNFKINVPGKFTVYNVLTAVVTCFLLGVNIELIKKCLFTLTVPGRMQPVENERGANIFIDYAHTPDALQSAISCVKNNIEGKVITVFGCGGDRDTKKRPIMGKIASELSDITIITSDNPRTENPNNIINDILQGIENKKNILTFEKRDIAIKHAINLAGDKDCILIAGKGHEDYQIIGTKKYDFDDYRVAKEFVSNNLSKVLTLGEIAKAVDGKLNYDKYHNLEIKSIVRSTEDYLKNSLFIAIKGEKFNGHDFVLSTYEFGCVCCIVDENIETNKPLIIVNDTRKSLLSLAKYYKSLFSITTIAITGSSGKTTTKDTVYDVLNQKYNVLKTQGNYNNEIGVPLTLFKLTEKHEVAVIEMGMNHFGEISNLTSIVKPDIAVITNIGNAHIENLKNKQGVLKAKLEIIEGLGRDGILVVNGDDDLLKNISYHNLKVIKYGKDANNDFLATNIINNSLRGIEFDVQTNLEKSFHVEVNQLGEFMIYNALVAISIGKQLNLSNNEIVLGLQNIKLSKNRLEIIKSNLGVYIINDTYNANPDSMSYSMRMLESIKTEAKKICIIGDMFELGSESAYQHEYIGKLSNSLNFDLNIFIGKQMENAYLSCIRNKKYYATQEELLLDIKKLKLEKNDIILVKGSRGMKLEKTVDKIRSDK